MTRAGTPKYMAPELCARKEYGVKVDVWSLGVIVFKMATTAYPVSNHTIKHEHYTLHTVSYCAQPYIL